MKEKKLGILPYLLLILAALAYVGAGARVSADDDGRSPSPTPTPTPSSTPTPIGSPTPTPTPTSSGSYVLLAWAELGMHCMDGKDYSVFSVLPPYNTVYAKLLQKGSQPLPVTSGVTITYEAIADTTGSINTISSTKTNFWNFSYTLFGAQLPPDVGLKLNRVQSLTPQPLKFDTTKGLWEAEGIPTSPVDDSGKTNPYPMIKVVARNSLGQIIAQSTVVPAVSDEMSCKTCHASGSNPAAMPASGWVYYMSDLLKDVKLNILKLHDRHVIPAAMLSELQTRGYNYQTSLYQTAQNLNNPILCAACHASNALNAAGLNTGVTGVPALTASVHSLHGGVVNPATGTTLDNSTSSAGSCYLCHPGVTAKCQRGAMRNTNCFDCHGNLSRLGVSTRAGWLNEPTCQMCHQNSTRYSKTFTTSDQGPNGIWRTSTDTRFATNNNVPATGFNLYRFSSGHGGVQCSGCHGSQHAEYPTNQPNDNVYSQLLQGYAGKLTECSTCHSTSPVTNNGGPHGMHTVGQAWVSAHPNYAESNRTQCAYCHGADYRGSPLSALLTTKTFKTGDSGSKTFPAGHQMNCYDCHNGPSGG